MKTWKLVVGLFLALFFVWFTLKVTGLIGRQASDSLNTYQIFPISSESKNFEVTIKPYKRGIYKYSAYLIFNGKNYYSDQYSQNIIVDFTETVCGSADVIGSSTLVIQSKPNKYTSHGLDWYGKIIKPSLLERFNPICLELEISSISEPVSPNLELKVSVLNTRPCWGIECMMD